jgi:hypothetical protein
VVTTNSRIFQHLLIEQSLLAWLSIDGTVTASFRQFRLNDRFNRSTSWA